MFTLTRVGLLASVVLTGIAMALYPGGTLLDRTSSHYSFFENSLSDLGSTVALNGLTNPGSSFELAAAIVFFVAGCTCVLGLVRVYSSSSKTRILARAGGVMVLVAGAPLVGTTLAPEDRVPALHGQFTLLMVGAFPMATALLTAATARDPRFHRRASVCWSVLTVIVVAWALAMLAIHPTTGYELAIPVTLQKAAGITLLATLVLQGYEAERVGSLAPDTG